MDHVGIRESRLLWKYLFCLITRAKTKRGEGVLVEEDLDIGSRI